MKGTSEVGKHFINASYWILNCGIFGEYEANERIEKERWLLIVKSVVGDVIFVVVALSCTF